MPNSTKILRRVAAAVVADRLGISYRTLYRWVADPKSNFPKPIKLNGRRYFIEADVIAWEFEHVGKEVA